MRKPSAVLSLLLCCSLASAQGAAPGLTRIGAAAAVHGLIKATAPGQVGRIVSSGKPLYLNDRVTSDAAGKLQVMLLDETVFTLGPNADMVLDEFVYDPNTNAGKVTATITKGAFRFVTGKLARHNPESMKVKLGVGTIGIRGTIVMGETGPDGSTVINAGAGSGNNAGEEPSALYVENAGTTVEVEQTGQGTTVSPDQPPAPPSDMSAQINALSQGLESGSGSKSASPRAADSADEGDEGPVVAKAPAEEGDSGEGESATEEAGQDAASGETLAEDLQEVQDDAQTFDDNLTKAIQDEIEEASNPFTTWPQMRAEIASGLNSYVGNGAFTQLVCGGVDCSNPGTWNFQVDVNFGTRNVSGIYGFSVPAGPIGDSGSFNFSYDGGGYVDEAGPAYFSALSGSGNTVVDFQFLNGADGSPAAQVEGNISHYDSSSNNLGFGETVTADKGPYIPPQ